MTTIEILRAFLNKSPSTIYPEEVFQYVNAIEYELEERYVELPVDGDGVPIHLLDHLKVDGEIGDFVVGNMTCCTDGWLVGTNRGQIGRPEKDAHHYKPQTVEDILREFADLVREEQVERAQISDEAIAEFAERLQLRGEDE